MKSSLFAFCLVLFTLSVAAQVKKISAPPKFKSAHDSVKAVRDSTWKALIKDKQKTEGLFTFYQDTATGSAFIYIKKDQLGKEFIYQSFSMGGPALLFLNQNMLRENWVFKVRKTYNKIEFQMQYKLLL